VRSFPPSAKRTSIPMPKGEPSRSGPASNTAPVDRTAFDLLHAMRQSASRCPICHLVLKGVAAYLDGISYENVNDPATRHDLRKSLGYCAAHGQEWLRLQDTLGTALIYRDVLTTVLEVLQSRVPSSHKAEVTEADNLMEKLQKLFGNNSAGSDLGRTLSAELEPSAPCPACIYTINIEKDLAESFAGALAHADFLEALRHHEMGLCLPHFRKVLALTTQPPFLRILVQVQQTKLETTLADLSEVIRKYDYRNTTETRGDEFKVPPRSVEQAAGSLPTQLNLPSSTER
jgi:hypothetical protein